MNFIKIIKTKYQIKLFITKKLSIKKIMILIIIIFYNNKKINNKKLIKKWHKNYKVSES